MPLDSALFEKLGAFYLGRPYDPVTKKGENTPLLYDSRDLVTHAVCVGMTGSGKTGLCLSLLEEAALDNIPAIIIDPKGDLANLLLTFPDLRPEDFRPWINEDDARRKGLEPDAFAAQQAKMWQTGLASWGESGDRIRTLRGKVEMDVYTPGSTAGIPVNIMGSFAAPETDDPEARAGRVQTTVASLLGLLKIAADPVKSREYILLAALLNHEWQQGHDLELSALIERIQHPPFQNIGVIDLEAFYPAKDRFDLVMALNNLLSAPNFSSWLKGDPLDVGRFLHTEAGKPRLAIFSIAHLGDDERMFFVSILLNEVLSWTRAQSGTTSLRAIVYMDEIFGYLPPTANPPSKLPMLTLLKQARAFGVGIVLATQNPVDLDYKALSNCGTWFIGRLQTERDKARVLDGLQGAAGGGKFDRQDMESVLAGLGNRVFLMNNVHDDGPVVFETRWTMSYLRGPLTKDQIKVLMAGRKPEVPVAAAPVATGKSSSQRPALPPSVPQVFLPATGGGTVVYAPRLLGAASVRFSDAKLGVEQTREVILSGPVPDGVSRVNWSAAQVVELALSELEKAPVEGAEFVELPAAATQPKNYAGWQKDFLQAVAANQTLRIFRSAELKAASKPDETEADFKARIAELVRKSREAELEVLEKKYAPKRAALQTRLAKAEGVVKQQKGQASQAWIQTIISVGSALVGLLSSQKKMNAAVITKATTAIRGASRSVKEGSDVGSAEESVESIQKQITDIDESFAKEKAAIGAAEPTIDVVDVRPLRGGVSIRIMALAWFPR